jgi:hypothetical protein
MPNGHDITEHKLLINCPVAQNPDIFTKVEGSIEALRKTLEKVVEDTSEAKGVAYSAKKKVDYLYWFFGTTGGLVATGSLLYRLFVG